MTVQDSKMQAEDETSLWDKICASNKHFRMLVLNATLQLTILMPTSVPNSYTIYILLHITFLTYVIKMNMY
jgi:hypothetical protein